MTVKVKYDDFYVSKKREVEEKYYNADLARKVDRGMSDNARKCLANGSKPPLGYAVDPVTKTYIIDESGAEIVRFIFQSYLDGMQIKKLLLSVKTVAIKIPTANLLTTML